MKVLLVGSGGREDALAWAIGQSPRLAKLCCAPGNAGIARRAKLVPLQPDDVAGLREHVRSGGYDLVVIGPEAPLVAGLADRLRADGVPTFGPSAVAAEIEGSKVFAKRFMRRHDIPTAEFEVCESVEQVRTYLDRTTPDYPLVLKADGLAAGKGVVLVEGRERALATAREMLDERVFGNAGERVIVEECLRGREVSFFALSDGKRFVELATCQDYKRVGEGDTGPNTGGMGSYSPSVYLDAATRQRIVDTVLAPTIRGLAAEDRPYRGVLYAGLMLTDKGPRVLEFNARFGDPEAQVLLPRLDGDWLETLHACAVGELKPEALRWKDQAAVCVVMTSGGYPGAYEKGRVIEGLGEIGQDDAEVFHAGTAKDAQGRWVTTGGRVLGVTALGRDLESARSRAYAAVEKIHWSGEHHRGDIARDAVELRARGGKGARSEHGA